MGPKTRKGPLPRAPVTDWQTVTLDPITLVISLVSHIILNSYNQHYNRTVTYRLYWPLACYRPGPALPVPLAEFARLLASQVDLRPCVPLCRPSSCLR